MSKESKRRQENDYLQDFQSGILQNVSSEPSLDVLSFNLLGHFDQSVAMKLAWIDGPENPWRNVIFSLSLESSAVLDSVLALASEDLAYKFPMDHPWVYRLRALSAVHRDAALSRLSTDIALLMQTPDPKSCTNDARYVLASVLILYNLELLTAAAARWRIHIRCAREIIQWRIQARSCPDATNIVDAFLLYEYYYTSVFINLTTFDATDEIPDYVSMGNAATVFSDFIQIMHLITQAERAKSTSTSTSDLISLEGIRIKTEAARDKMIRLGRTFEFKSTEAWRDFEWLVLMYYHATLIYSHQVLSESSLSEEHIKSSQKAILDHLLHLSRSASVAHDLVWPLFIAGSECRHIPHMQTIIESAMVNIIQASGSLDRRRVLLFLQNFWSSDLEPHTTWIQYARAKSINFSFLVIL